MVLGSEPVLGEGCEAEDAITASESLKMNSGQHFQNQAALHCAPEKKPTTKILGHCLMQSITGLMICANAFPASECSMRMRPSSFGWQF